jgi:molecular chaperone GrpE
MDSRSPDPSEQPTDPTEPTEAPAESAAPVDPATEIARLRRELDGKNDRYLRALADMDNARRRAQRERDEYVRYANESLLRDLLPTLDNLDRALEAARAGTGDPGVVEGVALIQRDLLKALERHGLERYSAVGATFDPTRHEAISRIISAEHPENTVVSETMPGYLLNGRVLRPAMVAVSGGSGEDAA